MEGSGGASPKKLLNAEELQKLNAANDFLKAAKGQEPNSMQLHMLHLAIGVIRDLSPREALPSANINATDSETSTPLSGELNLPPVATVISKEHCG